MNRLFNHAKNEPQHTVLVLEDDLPIADLIVELLKDAGYAALAASSAEQALKILDDSPLPDLFVVDYMLVDMNGRQFIESVRNRVGRNKMPPVLMLTASAEGEATAHSIQVEDYLPKPFNNQTLMEHITELLGSK